MYSITSFFPLPRSLLSREQGPRCVLPAEIWEEIASHLENAELQRLASLNSAFHNIALNTKYRRVILFQPYTNPFYSDSLLCSQMNRLLRLQEPYIIKRVRSLELDPLSAWMYIGPPKQNLSWIQGAWITLHAFLLRYGPDLMEMSRRLTEKLSNVTDLSIRKPSHSTEAFHELVHFVWTRFLKNTEPEQTTLRKLCLDLYPGLGLEDALVIPPSKADITRYQGVLAKLERMQLRLSGNRSEENFPSEQIQALRNIFQMLAATYSADSSSGTCSSGHPVSNLVSLYVSIYSGDAMTSQIVMQVFDALSPSSTPSQGSQLPRTPLPKLSHLSVVTSTCTTYPSINRFLSLHKHTITHLRISSHSYVPSSLELVVAKAISTESVKKEWAVAPSMTSLTYLEIAGRGHLTETLGQSGADTIRSFLVQSYSAASGVNTVIIDPYLPVAYEDLVYFCRGSPSPHYDQLHPSPHPSSMTLLHKALTHLRHLTMKFITLTPSHLIDILTYFPNLRSLHLCILVSHWQKPFRGSYHSPRLREWDLILPILNEEEGEELTHSGFLSELGRYVSLRGRKDASHTDQSYSLHRLEELRISLEDVDADVIETVEEALKNAFPEVKQVVVGNKIWINDGVFDRYW